MKTLLLLLVRAYQLFISPMLGQNCRFYPSCSDYAMQAVKLHGAGRGSALACRRLCRCHPWHAGGVDPVPPLACPAVPASSTTHLQQPLAVATTPDK